MDISPENRPFIPRFRQCSGKSLYLTYFNYYYCLKRKGVRESECFADDFHLAGINGGGTWHNAGRRQEENVRLVHRAYFHPLHLLRSGKSPVLAYLPGNARYLILHGHPVHTLGDLEHLPGGLQAKHNRAGRRIRDRSAFGQG